MRATATISVWLPCLSPFLSQMVLLEEKAAELYHLSLLGKKLVPSILAPAVFGLEKGTGKLSRSLHQHLFHQGFVKRRGTDNEGNTDTCYFRGDLGHLRFVFPQSKTRNKAPRSGLAIQPSRKAQWLMENPHCVEVKYLGSSHEVQIPQVGRFILAEGVELRVGSQKHSGQIFESAKSLALIMDLLAQNEDLQSEALNDFSEIRPPALLREFQENLREHGPGTVLWESALKIYKQSHSGIPGVILSSWYWEFMPLLAKTLAQLRERE